MSTTSRSKRPPARGGKGGRESRSVIVDREYQVAQLDSQGYTQYEIATQLKISQAAVSRILQRVEQRVLQDNADLVMRRKVELTRKLRHIHREAVRIPLETAGPGSVSVTDGRVDIVAPGNDSFEDWLRGLPEKIGALDLSAVKKADGP